MVRSELHQCECPHCRQETAHPDQELHRQMNLLLSRLDERQRRWYLAVESQRLGHGADRLLFEITGPGQKDDPSRQRGTGGLLGGMSWRCGRMCTDWALCSLRFAIWRARGVAIRSVRRSGGVSVGGVPPARCAGRAGRWPTANATARTRERNASGCDPHRGLSATVARRG